MISGRNSRVGAGIIPAIESGQCTKRKLNCDGRLRDCSASRTSESKLPSVVSMTSCCVGSRERRRKKDRKEEADSDEFSCQMSDTIRF
jgi:hypothetical protein